MDNTKKYKLFCLPYAGGTAEIYNKWKKYLNPVIELKPIELAGRGKRFNESFYNNFDDALNDIYCQIKNEIDDSNYAIYGHSMGSILAYELILKIGNYDNKMPIHAFFSGRYAPHINKSSKVIHTLNDDEIIDEISKYGGIPEQFLEQKELLYPFVPIIRADYRLIESYSRDNYSNKLNCDITVLNGKDDSEITMEDILQWENYTSAKFDYHNFEGNHFFINEKVEDVVQIINSSLVCK